MTNSRWTTLKTTQQVKAARPRKTRSPNSLTKARLQNKHAQCHTMSLLPKQAGNARVPYYGRTRNDVRFSADRGSCSWASSAKRGWHCQGEAGPANLFVDPRSFHVLEAQTQAPKRRSWSLFPPRRKVFTGWLWSWSCFPINDLMLSEAGTQKPLCITKSAKPSQKNVLKLQALLAFCHEPDWLAAMEPPAGRETQGKLPLAGCLQPCWEAGERFNVTKGLSVL